MTLIGIVGAGFIGGVHARLIDSIEGAQLGVVVDTDIDRARALADPRGARAVSSMEELARLDPLVDLIAICTSSAGHADLAIQALELGCHVLVEKPIDVIRAEADRLAEAAACTDRIVSVVSQRRFLPTSVALRDAVEQGRLGRLTGGTVESPFFRPQSYYDSGAWRGTRDVDGGGALMNQGIHVLDLLLWLLGEPVAVAAISGLVAHERIDVEDVIGAAISFDSGAVGTLFASTAAFPERPVRLTVTGTQGSAVIDGPTLRLSVAGEEILVEDVAPDGWTSIDWAHRAQYLDVMDAIRDARAPAIGIADGRRALKTVMAAYESAASGTTVSTH